MNYPRNNRMRGIGTGLREVFGRPWYVIIALCGAAVMLGVIVLINNYSILRTLSSLGLTHTLRTPWYALQLFSTNFTPAAQIIYSSIAVLFGINTAQLAYYLRQRATLQRAAGASVLGVIVSFLGIGCSACGSVLITTLFGFGATAVLVNALPLHGLEFGLIGIALLLWSVGYLAYKTEQPFVCATPSLPKKQKA